MSKNHFAKTHGLCNLTLLNSWLRRYEPEENCVSLPPESTEDDMANRSKDDYRQENRCAEEAHQGTGEST
jgi:hypothetical protein